MALARISQMARRSARSVHRLLLQCQAFTLNRVAGFCRTRRVKEGFHGFASVSAAFGHVSPIQMGNPGWYAGAGDAKVLTLWWSGDEVTVVSFRRGPWEQELLALGGREASPP